MKTAFLLALLFPTLAFAEVRRPNIVLIISDDHGARDSGCYGNFDVPTPHLDRLAREGMRFTHAFAASTLCSPSRAVIATGLMPFRNGHVFGGHIVPEVKTIAHFFRDLGYETANIGQFSKYPRNAFPYEHVQAKWAPSEHDAALIGFVDEFLAERDAYRPLFLEINTADTHMPWLDNEDFDPSSLTVSPHLVDIEETRQALAKYYTPVKMLDSNMGKIPATLEKKRGFLDGTLLIYTSDHGPNLPFAKWCLYDGGIRVPMLVVWPGVVTSSTTTDAMISMADIVPTLIEAALAARRPKTWSPTAAAHRA